MSQLTPQKTAKLIADGKRWFKVMTGHNLYPKQRDVLEDESGRIIKKKGRQTGSTTVFSHKLGRKPMQTERPGLGLVISVTDSQSKMVLRKIREGYRNSPFSKYLVKSNERELEFDNGWRIISRAVGNSGKQARGYSPDVVYATEAAFIDDDVYNAIEPSLFNTDGSLWLESSPNGTSGRFYRAWKDDGFSRHNAPSTTCPGVSQQQLENFREGVTQMKFRQEVLGEFVSDETTYFDDDLIDECASLSDLRSDRILDQNQYYLGVDIARKGKDMTVYVVLERPSNLNKLYVKEVISTEKKRTTDVMGRIQDLDRKYGFEKIGLDPNAVGAGVTDILHEKGVDHEPIKFSDKNKHNMYEGLTYRMENGGMKLPDPEETNDEDHRKLIEQMEELEKEFKSSGYLSLSHPKGGHDDFPDALAVGAFVAGQLAQTNEKREKGRPFMF